MQGAAISDAIDEGFDGVAREATAGCDGGADGEAVAGLVERDGHGFGSSLDVEPFVVGLADDVVDVDIVEVDRRCGKEEAEGCGAVSGDLDGVDVGGSCVVQHKDGHGIISENGFKFFIDGAHVGIERSGVVEHVLFGLEIKGGRERFEHQAIGVGRESMKNGKTLV